MNIRHVNILTGSVAILSLIFAGVSQHVFNMNPCPLCIIQRYVLIALVLGCLSSHNTSRIAANLTCLTGIGVAIYHSMIQGGAIRACDPSIETFVDALYPAKVFPLFFSPTGTCSDAYTLLGVPYPVAGGLLFVAILAFRILANKRIF